MTVFYHVVGRQGIGKSQLVLALAGQFQRQGLVCAGQDPDVFTSRGEALRERPGAEVYFIEHQDESEIDDLPALEPGGRAVVISMRECKREAANA